MWVLKKFELKKNSWQVNLNYADYAVLTFQFRIHRQYYCNNGTSNKGHSILRTQYKKPLYKGQVFLTQTTTFLYFQCIINLQEEDTSLLRTKIAGPNFKVSFA